MAFWTDTKFREPLRQNRWYIEFGNNTLDKYRYALKECKKPEFEINVTEHRLLTHVLRFPGILKWKPIEIKFVSGRNENKKSLDQELLNRIYELGYIHPNTSVHQQISKSNQNVFLKIIQVDVNGNDIEKWILKNPFFSNINFGSLTYENDGFVEISTTIQYDWAELEVLEPETDEHDDDFSYVNDSSAESALNRYRNDNDHPELIVKRDPNELPNELSGMTLQAIEAEIAVRAENERLAEEEAARVIADIEQRRQQDKEAAEYEQLIDEARLEYGDQIRKEQETKEKELQATVQNKINETNERLSDPNVQESLGRSLANIDEQGAKDYLAKNDVSLENQTEILGYRDEAIHQNNIDKGLPEKNTNSASEQNYVSRAISSNASEGDGFYSLTEQQDIQVTKKVIEEKEQKEKIFSNPSTSEQYTRAQMDAQQISTQPVPEGSVESEELIRNLTSKDNNNEKIMNLKFPERFHL